MNWDADFAGLPPIDLQDGRKPQTLADLRGDILALPKRERPRLGRRCGGIAEGR